MNRNRQHIPKAFRFLPIVNIYLFDLRLILFSFLYQICS
ncbi:hypothetical protein LEP1GSC195_0695 [Leptospira wolbachii serovar Codice str. CDC]|uniref:Uncharacterized protein n=1 Tax=Leptospira wolbachii serovar Codice str. CDC TaxID=1218599 RepID=R8ZY41_9LEPT|nr:hypothetical protein LEP1GSC195_0695 [Leptospira wolbachii serovar Codice str. CDC]